MMPQGQLSCTPDTDGTLVITRGAESESDGQPQVVARVYAREYALVMAKSPELLGALQWLRTLVVREACYCEHGIRECVVCVTDDLIAAIERGTEP